MKKLCTMSGIVMMRMQMCMCMLCVAKIPACSH